MHVYIAGPYSGPPGPEENTRRALVAAEQFRRLGHLVFCPHSMFGEWDRQHPGPWQQWIDQCLGWIRGGGFHVLVRLPGDSPGADLEETLARDLGIDVLSFDPSWAKLHGGDEKEDQ